MASTRGHLAYYLEHGISPVRYRMADLEEHFERRDSLYRSLGLPPVAIRGARVLEVAPGSGQNSLWIAACRPASYDLVEPNPTGTAELEAAYAGLDIAHTGPVLHRLPFEEFEPAGRYDIVICENWLGSLPEERRLLARLASLVGEGGALVVTTVPLAGFLPNVMRKLLALRLLVPGEGFEPATGRLLAAFGPHLDTIAGMTRSHRDWVHDCMMNPHYLHVALPLGTLVETVGEEMELLGTCPRFVRDWRWFKAMAGAGRNFNATALEAERRNLHNFIDCRAVFPERPSEANAGLAALCEEGWRAALSWQQAHEGGDPGARDDASRSIGATLGRLADELRPVSVELGDAFAELGDCWAADAVTPEGVAGLERFGGLFGRETVYVSLTRSRSGRNSRV